MAPRFESDAAHVRVRLKRVTQIERHLTKTMSTFEVSVTSEKIQCETFDHKGDLVILLRFLSETLTDDEEKKVLDALRTFVQFQKNTPKRYHMIIDTHAVLVFPMERIINIYNFIARKEKYLRPHAISTSYILQGKVAEMALSTLNTMFETWTTNTTFQCFPSTTCEKEREIPTEVYSKVIAFIDTAKPPKAP